MYGIFKNGDCIVQAVREKYESHQEGMKILSLQESDLINAVPTGSAVQESNTVRQLRKFMDDVSALYKFTNSVHFA